MASRLAMLKHSAATDYGSFLGLRRWIHGSALPPPLGAPISHPPPSQSLVFPESDQTPESNNNSNIGFGFGFGFGFPSFPLGGGSMELMAVPKKKVSRHKRGIRNGPKALKPIPVIIRCNTATSVAVDAATSEARRVKVTGPIIHFDSEANNSEHPTYCSGPQPPVLSQPPY